MSSYEQNLKLKSKNINPKEIPLSMLMKVVLLMKVRAHMAIQKLDNAV